MSIDNQQPFSSFTDVDNLNGIADHANIGG